MSAAQLDAQHHNEQSDHSSDNESAIDNESSIDNESAIDNESSIDTHSESDSDSDSDPDSTSMDQSIVKPAALKSKKKPNFAEAQDIATVNVRYKKNPPQRFRVHVDFLCHYSPYFEATFKGRFSESETLISELDDTEPEVFSMFVDWIYSQKVALDVDENAPAGSASSPTQAVRNLIDLWILADRLIVPRLQNQAIDELHRVERKFDSICGDAFRRIYNHTDKGSPLRRIAVEWYSGFMFYTIHDPKDFPQEMLVDIIGQMRANWNSHAESDCIEMNIEDYHVSEDVPPRRRNPGSQPESPIKAK